MTSLPNFWRIMQLQQQWRKLHPHQLPCDIDTQALKQPEHSSGLISEPISGSPHQHIIGTEKAQPLLGSDNVARVTPERGDWRSQALANATSAEDGEFAALQPAQRLDEGLSSSMHCSALCDWQEPCSLKGRSLACSVVIGNLALRPRLTIGAKAACLSK